MSEVIKISDAIANYLKIRGIKHVFGIIGSANSHIFDSINTLGYTEIICVHHEQAATMAMQTYFRVTGKMTAALVTAGGGSTNAITGVMSAWADSIPGVIISGQENVRFINKYKNMRMWGIQGYDSAEMVHNITKYSARVMDPKKSIYELQKAFYIAGEGRPGPVWIDYPMDIQGSSCEQNELIDFIVLNNIQVNPKDLKIDQVNSMICEAKRPVFWFGHGIRLAKSESKLERLLEILPFPFLVSWAGIDMIESAHMLNFGSAGVYGNRAANFVLQNADLVIAIGNRMAIPMIGYEHSEFARDAKIVQVDIDQMELDKTSDIADLSILSDAGDFIDALLDSFSGHSIDEKNIEKWRSICSQYRFRYPPIGEEHADNENFINSYRFIGRLCSYLKNDQLITTDMGTALLSGHQAIKLKKGQRLMTSTGLGEMGYGLPAAIGASFASNRGEVICLNCDGGMMMNLQELQTVVHHQLPIKLFIFNNDGYLMIKHTQKNLFKGRYSAVNKSTGVSCPDFKKIAYAFGMPYYSIQTWIDFDSFIEDILNSNGPVICDVFMDPEQYFYPKLSLAISKDGSIVSPPLEDLSPLLTREELSENMLIGLHEKSKKI